MCFIDFHIFLKFKGISWKKKHKVGHVHFADLYNTFEQQNLHYNPYQPELDFRHYMKNVARKPVWLMMAAWACQCQQLEARDAWMTAQWAFSLFIWKSRSLDDIHTSTEQLNNLYQLRIFFIFYPLNTVIHRFFQLREFILYIHLTYI
jgi:hypothetical protein